MALPFPPGSTSRRFRIYQSIAYGCLGLAGVVLMIDPTRSIEDQEILIRVLLSGFLVTGSTIATVGSIRDHWIVEFVGLPFLWAAVAAFVVILVAVGNTGAYAVGCFFTAIFVILLRRFHDLWSLLSVTKKVAKDTGT